MNKHVQTAVHFATVEGRALAAALKPIAFVVDRLNSYPILAMVKLKLDGTTLSLSGTDLDIEVSVDLDVNDCAGEWETCIPARLLHSIARVAGPMAIKIEPRDRIEARDGKASVQPEVLVTLDDGAAIYTLLPLAADSFPSIPGERGEKTETFTNGQLASALSKCSSAMSTEETRYYLNGVCWTISDAGRWFAATDGHRLLKHDYTSEAGAALQHIIPRKAVLLLTRFFKGADATIYANAAPHRLDITAGDFTMRMKTIEGAFPDIQRVIPSADKVTHSIEVNPLDITAALRRLGVLRSHSGNTVRFFRDGGSVCIEMRNNSYGEVRAVLHGSEWPEGLTDFGLNATYLRDMVANCDGPIRIGLQDAAGAPVLFSDGDATMTRVQMRMRV